MLSSTLLSLLPFVSFSVAGYVVKDDYTPENFFDKFGFFTNDDPTNGFVDYVSHDAANQSSFIDTSDGTIYLGVDHTNKAPKGRQSVRLFSYESYNEGLFILDLNHFPGGVCGTWPAFWMVGPKWPTDGEIDILEGANSQVANQMTLHTGTGCEITGSTAMSGSILETNCDAKASEDNSGCGVSDSESGSFSGLNENGGGVFATEIDPSSNVINVWFFARGSVPEDIGSGSPKPTSWGKPTAIFKGGCEISSHFKDLQIVFNTDFCGDWAGNTWSTDEKCSALADTCDSYVANNPEAFKDAYWSINSLKVYEVGEDAPASTSAPASISAPATSSAAVSTPEPTTSSAPVSTPAPVSTTEPTSSAAAGLSIGLSLGLPSIPLIPEGTSTAAVVSTPEASAPAVSTPVVSTPAVSTPAAPLANTPSTPAYGSATNAGNAAPVAASSATSTGTHVFASGVPLPYASTASAPTIGVTGVPAGGAAPSAAGSSPAGSSPAVSTPAVSTPAAAAASPAISTPAAAASPAASSPAVSSPAANGILGGIIDGVLPSALNLAPASTTTDVVMETDVVQSVSTQIITVTATGPAPAATAPVSDVEDAAAAFAVKVDSRIDALVGEAVNAKVDVASVGEGENEGASTSEGATDASAAPAAAAPSAWFKVGQRGEPVSAEGARRVTRAVRDVRGGRGVWGRR